MEETKALFNYNGNTFYIKCKKDSKMEYICNQFIIKTGLNANDIYFLFKEKELQKNLTFKEMNCGTHSLEILVKNKKNIIKISNYNYKIIEYITIIYKPSERIKLFGYDFVKNNEKNCKILISNKEYELSEYLNIPSQDIINNHLEVRLIIKDYITNMSYV